MKINLVIIPSHNHYFKGVVESYNALGLKYMRGTGVKQNITEAKYWFKKCADLGLAEGELNLGFVLKKEGNFYEAMELFQSAAVKGCARAYANLGDLYRDGHGVKKNTEKARQMYEKAIEYGLTLDIEEELKIIDIPSLGESTLNIYITNSLFYNKHKYHQSGKTKLSDWQSKRK